MPVPAPSAIPTDYPLVAYNYRVIVGAITMRFTKVEGLVWERSAVTYRDGLSFRWRKHQHLLHQYLHHSHPVPGAGGGRFQSA